MIKRQQTLRKKIPLKANLYYLVLIVFFVPFLSGCGVVVMTAVDTVRGGSSELNVIQEVQDLQAYNTVKLEPFTDSSGGKESRELLAQINSNIFELLSQNGINMSDNGSLQIYGEIIYQDDGFRKNLIIAQLTLRDQSTGQTLGIVNITGKVAGAMKMSSTTEPVAKIVVQLLIDKHFSQS